MFDTQPLYKVAKVLLAPRKGILAADQSVTSMNKQLESLGLKPTPELRRLYRQLLFTTPGMEEFVSGVILHDASIRNHTDEGTKFSDVLIAKGIIPIIKVDKGTVPHDNYPREVLTQGLDDLAERAREYYNMGARASKWRAVLTISDNTPTMENLRTDAMTMARYASIMQNAGLLPIVEPEVLFSGSHSLRRAQAVTTETLRVFFSALVEQKVDLKAVILKSSMVLAGSSHKNQSTPEEVAVATIETFKQSVPETVPGIVFLSGGQTPKRATANLNAIAKLEAESDLPWEFAFSFSRGIEEPVQNAWLGKKENVPLAQAELIKRLRLNSLADGGEYSPDME